MQDVDKLGMQARSFTKSRVGGKLDVKSWRGLGRGIGRTDKRGRGALYQEYAPRSLGVNGNQNNVLRELLPDVCRSGKQKKSHKRYGGTLELKSKRNKREGLPSEQRGAQVGRGVRKIGNKRVGPVLYCSRKALTIRQGVKVHFGRNKFHTSGIGGKNREWDLPLKIESRKRDTGRQTKFKK